jgi:DNA polymerase (family 10)
MSMDRIAAAHVLEQIASYLELKGENPFRVRAFRGAAKAVLSVPRDLSAAIADGSLAATKGVGPATLGIIRELNETGKASMLEELREEVPPGLIEMLGVSGLGVTRIRTIHEKLGIETLSELEEAARQGTLAGLPGFGPRTADAVLKGIARLRRGQAFRLSHHAADEAAILRDALGRLPGVNRAIVAGEVRRRTEVVREVVVVLVTEGTPADLFRALGEMAGVDEVTGSDERQVTLRFASGTTARVIATPPANFGAVLVQATGSESHLQALAAHGTAHGFALNAAGLWRGREFVPTPDEAVLYAALGLDEIPPELREGGDEIARAEARTLPRLIDFSDLHGFLHCHTSYSDGNVTVEEMAAACRDAGYSYVGITDHSKAAAYAGGLTEADLVRQWAEIDEVNAKRIGIRVLKGIESDILADGRLDYDDGILAGFDFVIASVHSRFQMDAAAMTARVLRALDNPYLTILGHPTGRLLLSRDPYPLDLEQVFARAGARGVAIEINADPHRLDLDWRMLRRARAAGAMISIGADAHNRAGLAYMAYGIGMARKGGLTSGEVLNARTAAEFLQFAGARRGR